MTGRSRQYGWLLALLGCLPAIGQAQWVEAEGMAAMAAGVAPASQAAIQDALEQAGLTVAAQVHAVNTINRNAGQSESLVVRPAAAPKDYAILREWKSDGLYHVLLKANIEQGSATLAAVAVHKKKVTVARFYLANPRQGEDIADLDTGLAQEMARRLDSTGRFIARATDELPFTVQHSEYVHAPDGTLSADRVRQIAEHTGSQFVLTGRILDAGATQKLAPFFGHTSEINTGQGALAALPFSDLAAGLARQPMDRRLEVELLVYDGMSGAQVGRHLMTAQASGSGRVGRDKKFGSAAFFTTHYGKTVDLLLGELVQSADKDLSCLPFMARVVRIEGGRAIIDTGTTAGLRPGDRLTAYRASAGAPVMGLNNELLGYAERPAASLVIQQVQPLFAIGELSPAGGDLKPGDIVRTGS